MSSQLLPRLLSTPTQRLERLVHVRVVSLPHSKDEPTLWGSSDKQRQLQ